MITRGHYFGEIIDELSAIGEQVKMRNALGLTDLSVFVEAFFQELINALLKTRLVSLNSDRSNEPGLDLGDEGAHLGVQVTAKADAAKVNSTLQKITPEQAGKFNKIIVLVVGQKQRTYSLDPALSKKYSFSKTKNIWDLTTLARRALSLELPDLQRVHALIRSSIAKVKVELEIPDVDGKYPTSGFDHWEEKVTPKIGNGAAFSTFCIVEYDVELSDSSRDDLGNAIKNLAQRLARLPRVTREFLAMLLERRETKESKRFKSTTAHLVLAKVSREYLGNDLKGELDILDHANFISVDGESPQDYGPAEIGVWLDKNEDLALGFLDFIQRKNLDLRRVVGSVDFSAF